jgi:hypothetical protein
VISKEDFRQIAKRLLLTAVLLLLLIAIGLIVSAVSAQRAEKHFAQAADFPRGALVYAQFKDLPALLKQWNESQVKDRFLGSVNQQQFWTRHLANKLFARWEEFNTAAGFPIDLGAFGSVADNRAAVAVYDIGKLDLVLIAPMSEARLEACRFFQGKDNFEATELPDGTTYYLHDVEADRGRQKQHIAFASVKGRFVLSTSERLLLRAIANINGEGQVNGTKDRLTDEPSFQMLAKTVTPHFVTVWVEQSKLNDDWYFKHYWLMSDIGELKNIRAGMFDLEMQQGRWVERREFLLTGKGNPGAALPKQTVQRIEQMVPADVPFVQMRAVGGNPGATAELVSGALFEGKVDAAKTDQVVDWQDDYDSEFEVPSRDGEFDGDRYSYLSHDFDSKIDETEESGKADASAMRLAAERKFARTLQSALQPAHPLAAAKLARPRAIEGPLFAEFARATVVTLQNSSALNQAALEQAIGELAAGRLMIAGAFSKDRGGKFVWKNQTEGGVEWREMELPVLGRSVGYGLRGNELVISNNRELLTALMAGRQAESVVLASPSSPVHELTVIRLRERKQAFDQIFAQLEAPLVKAYWQQRRGESSSGPSLEFFSGEIASLLDVASPVDEVRIQRSYLPGRLREEVTMILK